MLAPVRSVVRWLALTSQAEPSEKVYRSSLRGGRATRRGAARRSVRERACVAVRKAGGEGAAGRGSEVVGVEVDIVGGGGRVGGGCVSGGGLRLGRGED